ncbi:MAG: hypothetical protein PVF57_15725 [Pseudomonadales bacterium]|jgi:hypothetical protein
MDRFELNWPNMDAQLLTDGWRCRIVWRQRGQRRQHSGIGGTIDNNLQCVQRVAESLDGVPYLIGALKARGHDRLARQIESLAGESEALASVSPEEDTAPGPGAVPEKRAAPEGPAAEPQRAARKALPATRTWVSRLEGSVAFEPASNRRARTWIDLGPLGDSGEVLMLKAPAPKGKAEWVLKRTWPDDAGRKAEYVAAEAFRGIAAWLVSAGADDAFVDNLFSATAALDHASLVAAAGAWRSVHAATH